ncbi:MAG: hypothetical protein PHU99_05685 [Candidatus Cloacimonetes bacterium]|mgnify:CR=1 FL=1|jgi:hypothetical protein|nr:hypothetical protein [Candidatus Cloacimonadota bacterium]MDY0336547.1 hypothetical protein [Candidatus Cloacimonadaceae bacterium]MCB5269153.1 hypothetical protein [Candidatus Cloacimonadota bacterium]MCK9334952.1 hypothetical protein [Candidatus Cloacimonadota bacterium]MDD2542918.1 hypothetical protein [Candidatus Cloacimonadota bacterium]
MKKFFKTILFLGGAAAAAHYGMKAYKRVNGTVKLSKSLPEFLSNVYGEFPKVDITRSMNYLKIKIGFTQAILDKHDDIETTVREYIDDFYPDVAKCSVEIDIHVKGEEEAELEPEPEKEEEVQE